MNARGVLARLGFALATGAAAGGLGFYALRSDTATGGSGRTAVGRFEVGGAGGEERAGFSGRAKLQVFADPEAPEWLELKACLEDPALDAELGAFTPILVDTRDPADRGVERRARELGFQVVVRALSGKFLGGLERGFSCEELVRLLGRIRQNAIFRRAKSPIYRRLLETTQPVEALLEQGDRAGAERLAELLREFEGPESPAVEAVDRVLGR